VATNFSVGTNPTTVGVGDFNVDGNVDLAVSNLDSNNVSVLLGSGTGSFAGAITFAVGLGPNSLAVGDLNADGKPDIATANTASNNVSVLLNITLVTPVNLAPSITSTPIAFPSPAGVAQAVLFTCSAVDPEGGSVSIEWTFGDGVMATSSPTQHAYTAAGSYSVSVTATDPQGLHTTVMFTLVVNAPIVGTGADSDGDGFSDVFENAVGTLPSDASSTPTGGPAMPPVERTFHKLAVGLNFSKANHDSIALAGTLALPSDFPFAGQKVIVDVGGAILTFILDANAKSQPKLFTLKIDPRFRTFRFTMKTKGSFGTPLSDHGLANITSSHMVDVPVTMIFANEIYRTTFRLSYRSKAGKFGRTAN
jgi:PKD repeat protein